MAGREMLGPRDTGTSARCCCSSCAPEVSAAPPARQKAPAVGKSRNRCVQEESSEGAGGEGSSGVRIAGRGAEIRCEGPAWQRSPTALSQQRCGSDSCGWRGDASLCICNRGFAGSACSGFHGERLVVGEGAAWQTVQSWKYRYSVCFPRCMNKIINS